MGVLVVSLEVLVVNLVEPVDSLVPEVVELVALEDSEVVTHLQLLKEFLFLIHLRLK